MSPKFAGTVLCAFMLGLIGAGEAKADAIGFASLDFSTAFFSAPGTTTPADLSHVTFNSVLDTLTNSAGLDSSSGSLPASRSGLNQNTVDPTQVSFGTYSGGENNFGFTANNTNFARSDSILTGNLKQGNVVAKVVAETQVLNGHTATASTLSTSSSNDNFTANSNLTLQLNVGGALTLYTKLYNSANPGQTADASAQFIVTLVDLTSGTTALNFKPDLLNTSLSATTTPEQSGSTSATQFFLASAAFTLIAHDHYSLTITQSVQSDASAAATAVPEPGTITLFGAGLAVLGLLSVRRRGTEGHGLGL